MWYSGKFFKISLLLGGKGKHLPDLFEKSLWIFLPPCLCRVAKRASWVWWKIWQIRTDLDGGNVMCKRVGTKLLLKDITKQLFLFFFFDSWRRLRYPSLLMLWISSVCYWKTSTLFIVFTSEVTKPHHVWKSFFSSISRSQFWSINKYILCCTQHRKCNTHIIHKIRRGNGKFSSMY